MDGEHFKRTIKGLGFTQGEFGEFIGVTIKSVNDWGRSGPPLYVVRILEGLLRSEMPFAPSQLKSLPEGPRFHARRAFAPMIAGLIDEAGSKGWKREDVFAVLAEIVEAEQGKSE